MDTGAFGAGLLLAICCLLLLYCEAVEVNHPTASEIDAAIDKAIDFLYKNQLEYGEFRTYICNNYEMSENCSFDSSPFVTAMFLHSVDGLDDERVVAMATKAEDFLRSEQEPGGVWYYWTSRNLYFAEPRERWGPDLDDTSLVSFVLRKRGAPVEDNEELISGNRDETSLFFTWLEQNESENDIDCVVNTNVLLYLGENDQQVCEYVNRAIKLNLPCSKYYPKKLALFYMTAKAFENNITCLEESRKDVISAIRAERRADGSFGNDLDTALALNALMVFGYGGPEVSEGMQNLLLTQSQNGSWNRECMYVYFEENNYGSEELTTALALEALNRYRNILRH